MSSEGSSGAGQLADAITLVQESQEIIDGLLRRLGEGHEDKSEIFPGREPMIQTEADGLTLLQSLQRVSEKLGDVLRYDARTSQAGLAYDSDRSHDDSTTLERVPELEEVLQAGAEDQREVSVGEPEASAAEAPTAILDPQSIGREVGTGFSASPSRSRDIGIESEEPPTTASAGSPPEVADECTICFEIITTLCILQPCNHSFDMNCIIPWLTSLYAETGDEERLRCPLCRQVIETIRHSIVGDGTAHMMIVGPYFRQQYLSHEPRGQWEVRMPPAGSVTVHRPAGPFLDLVAEAIRRSVVDMTHRRQRDELRLPAGRGGIFPPLVHGGYLEDETFERLGRRDILMIDRRERTHPARSSELEAMGEGASTDLETSLRGTFLDMANVSSTHLGVVLSRRQTPAPTRRESSPGNPRARDPSTGVRTGSSSGQSQGRAADMDITQRGRRRHDDSLRESYNEELAMLLQRRGFERGGRSRSL